MTMKGEYEMSASNGKRPRVLVLENSHQDGPTVCRIIKKIGPEPTWVPQVRAYGAGGFLGKKADFGCKKPRLEMFVGRWQEYALILANGNVGPRISGFNLVPLILAAERPVPFIGIDNCERKNEYMTARKANSSTTSKRDPIAFEAYLRKIFRELKIK